MEHSIWLFVILSLISLPTLAEQFEAFEFQHQMHPDIPAYFDPYGQANTHFGGWKQASTPKKPSTLVLSDLFKAYTLTMRDLGIRSWLAQGTLLAWYWNQKIFPWDADLDVHISLTELYTLAQHHNMTVYQFHFSNTPEGKVEEYLLDVNPHYQTRIVGRSDRNKIDARFISLSNGAYIDITAVHALDPHAKRKGKPFLWQTKDGHIYDDVDVYPLQQTVFEGILTYAPNNVEKISAKDYSENALKDDVYQGYKFDTQENEWIAISAAASG